MDFFYGSFQDFLWNRIIEIGLVESRGVDLGIPRSTVRVTLAFTIYCMNMEIMDQLSI